MTNMLERIEALLVSLRDQVDAQADHLRALATESATLQREVQRLRAELRAQLTRPLDSAPAEPWLSPVGH
jgi:regulator of replication initiation timing